MISELSAELLRGAGDIHIHTAPSLVPDRKSDIRGLIEACQAAGMAFGIVKWHHGDSYSAAAAARGFHDGPFQIYGGLVLNQSVGGLNPFAVDAAVALAAKIIWLPTLDAEEHARVVGRLGGFPSQTIHRRIQPQQGLRVIDDDGNLLAATRQILDLLHGTDTVLATGHVAKAEIYALQRYIQKERLAIKLLVNHVTFSVPDLNLEDIETLAAPDVWFELAYLNFRRFDRTRLDAFKAVMEKCPGVQFVLTSDSGQGQNPISPEAMRLFIERLLKNGWTPDQLRKILHQHTPKLMSLA